MDYEDDDPRNLKNLEEKFKQSAKIAIQTKGAKKTNNPLGTGSFQKGLSETPGLATLGLTSNVTGFGRDDVKPVAPGKFKVMFSTDGLILTHDGAYPIDSNGGKCRYVILLAADGAYLYTDQCISESIRLAPEDVFNYPTLASHGQIDGIVIGAGDMLVDHGQVRYLDSQSGSFHPTGANLAATLKLFVRTGLISEKQIVAGDVDVQQFIATGGHLNVDEGDLVRLLGAAMEGSLRSKTAGVTPTTSAHSAESDSEEADTPEKDDRDGEGEGDAGVFDFDDL